MATYQCPNGHQSDDPQFCSVCGAEIAPSAADTAPLPIGTPPAVPVGAGGGPACPKCGKIGQAGDTFCQYCGTDYVSGSAPPDPAAATPVAPAAGPTVMPAPTVTGGPSLTIIASVDTQRLEESRSEDQFREPANAGNRTFIITGDAEIGRTGQAQVRLDDDRAVSHHHARIVLLPDGAFGLQDLGSANGTTLNGAPLVGAEVKPLVPGDVIELGYYSRLTVSQ